MNANEVVESYVTDVAVQLGRRQRNDVAFELRALLTEGLQAQADAAGTPADAAMATEFVRAFGPPAEVAARYRPTLTIVDPADGPGFLRATVIGLAAIWGIGLVVHLGHPGVGLLIALGRWWVGTVIPSLWWPGVLVVSFGLGAWVRRRWSHTVEWKPRSNDRLHGGLAAMMMAVVGILCGLFVLVDPRWLLDILMGGRAAPAAYQALTYTETFRQRQGPILLALVSLNIPMLIAVMVKGRWSPFMRKAYLGLGLITCAVMIWTVLEGPVFAVSSSDGMAKAMLVLVVGLAVVTTGLDLRRRVRPAPDHVTQ